MVIKDQEKFVLYVDGAARNNPGPAGAGLYIKKNDIPILSKGFYLGSKTNNEAEYLALLLGLFYIQELLNNGDYIEIISDSELLVKQINGDYKIKKPELKKLNNLAMSFLKKMNYNIRHIPREQNKEADKKANQAIDKKISLENNFLNFLQENEIFFNF